MMLETGLVVNGKDLVFEEETGRHYLGGKHIGEEMDQLLVAYLCKIVAGLDGDTFVPCPMPKSDRFLPLLNLSCALDDVFDCARALQDLIRTESDLAGLPVEERAIVARVEDKLRSLAEALR